MCSVPATAEPRLAAATTPFFFCLPVSVFVLARSLLSSSMTSTGEPAKSSFGARGCFRIGCPCLWMSARPSRPICGEIVLRAKRAGCSFA